MTHREEQSMRRRIKSTHIAESGCLTAALPPQVTAKQIF
jgi:hypothetical protein